MTPAPVKSLPRRSGNGGHGGGGGHDNTGAMRWLLTYADLITLLMVFFVVMYSISTVQAQKWAQVASSLKASFYGGTSAIDLNNPPGAPGITGGQSGPSPLEQAGQAIAGAIASDKLPQGVAVYYGERGLTISVEGSLLFPGGQAYLTPEARKVLIVIAGVLAGLPNKISVEGHTDNYPIHNAQFPSNWDLSVARAVAVVRFLTEDAGLKPDRFIAVGRAQWDRSIRTIRPRTGPKTAGLTWWCSAGNRIRPWVHRSRHRPLRAINCPYHRAWHHPCRCRHLRPVHRRRRRCRRPYRHNAA